VTVVQPRWKAIHLRHLSRLAIVYSIVPILLLQLIAFSGILSHDRAFRIGGLFFGIGFLCNFVGSFISDECPICHASFFSLPIREILSSPRIRDSKNPFLGISILLSKQCLHCNAEINSGFPDGDS
jgi:hypothetical protein